ncbi:nuclear fragile x mental retardation protein interacting protein [Anaeramoeba flamelloides]|uniref:Nuclear fragile x mental retardation protein interacting protein n=1 Tax=Anaeramoeba flamelloides TaxID=1746091 RepID=A0ABQ8Z4Y3_9EUKA|nr:nuclear fragile x mental retardation protein interacting protein [Anaeramoeba flamelloides]
MKRRVSLFFKNDKWFKFKIKQIDEYSTNNNSNSERVNKLNKNKDQLETRINEQNKTINSLQDAVKSEKTKFEKIEQELTSQKEQQKKLIESYEEKIKKLEEYKRRLVSDLKREKKAHKDCVAAKKNVTKEYQDLKLEKDTTEKRVDKLTKQNDDLQFKLDRNNRKKKTLLQKTQNLSNQVLDKKNKKLKERKEKIKQLGEQLKTNDNEHSKSIKELETKDKEHREKIKQLGEQLKTKIVEHSKSIKKLEAKLTCNVTDFGIRGLIFSCQLLIKFIKKTVPELLPWTFYLIHACYQFQKQNGKFQATMPEYEDNDNKVFDGYFNEYTEIYILFTKRKYKKQLNKILKSTAKVQVKYPDFESSDSAEVDKNKFTVQEILTQNSRVLLSYFSNIALYFEILEYIGLKVEYLINKKNATKGKRPNFTELNDEIHIMFQDSKDTKKNNTRNLFYLFPFVIKKKQSNEVKQKAIVINEARKQKRRNQNPSHRKHKHHQKNKNQRSKKSNHRRKQKDGTGSSQKKNHDHKKSHNGKKSHKKKKSHNGKKSHKKKDKGKHRKKK